MSIESEIREHMGLALRDSNTKSRDIELVIYFYGFKDNPWPTLDDAAQKFNVGDSEARRSERPRQIINSKFKDLTSLKNLPLLKDFSEYLKSSNIHFPADLVAYAKKKKLFNGKINMLSALRLLHDLGDSEIYQAYAASLIEITRAAVVSSQDFLIANTSVISRSRKALKIAKTIPGLLGIARLAYLKEKSIAELISYEDVVKLIKLDQDSWVFNNGDQQYYLFESRDNTLINSLEKIKSISDYVDINTLTQVLRNSLNRRTPPGGRAYPPAEVIRQYLSTSKYIEMHGSDALLKLEAEVLTDIEKAATEYMYKNNVHNFPQISSHLSDLGYSKPLIDKTILNSPLIFVDKSKGRYHYSYQLAGKKGSIPNPEVDRYELFRQRLIQVARDGTDKDQETTARLEQHVLREWLFKDKKFEECAICQKNYAVGSLRAAHKKMRAGCAENERTDPNIVMPLCVFGCDYIFEERFVYIEHGKIMVATKGELYSENEFIKNVEGKILNSRWVKGGEEYFAKPS